MVLHYAQAFRDSKWSRFGSYYIKDTLKKTGLISFYLKKNICVYYREKSRNHSTGWKLFTYEQNYTEKLPPTFSFYIKFYENLLVKTVYYFCKALWLEYHARI